MKGHGIMASGGLDVESSDSRLTGLRRFERGNIGYWAPKYGRDENVMWI